MAVAEVAWALIQCAANVSSQPGAMNVQQSQAAPLASFLRHHDLFLPTPPSGSKFKRANICMKCLVGSCRLHLIAVVAQWNTSGPRLQCAKLCEVWQPKYTRLQQTATSPGSSLA